MINVALLYFSGLQLCRAANRGETRKFPDRSKIKEDVPHMPNPRRRDGRRPRIRPYVCPASESGRAGVDTRTNANASEQPLTVRLPEGLPRLSPEAAKVLLRILLDATHRTAPQPSASPSDAADPVQSSPRWPTS